MALVPVRITSASSCLMICLSPPAASCSWSGAIAASNELVLACLRPLSRKLPAGVAGVASLCRSPALKSAVAAPAICTPDAAPVDASDARLCDSCIARASESGGALLSNGCAGGTVPGALSSAEHCASVTCLSAAMQVKRCFSTASCSATCFLHVQRDCDARKNTQLASTEHCHYSLT